MQHHHHKIPYLRAFLVPNDSQRDNKNNYRTLENAMFSRVYFLENVCFGVCLVVEI